MSTTDTARRPATIDGATLRILPTPSCPKAQFTSLDGVRTEMARIYREAESGKRDTAEASKLTYMLAQIGRVRNRIEMRLKALESRSNGGALPALGRSS